MTTIQTTAKMYRLQTGDSTRGFSTVVVCGRSVLSRAGLGGITDKMVAAFHRGKDEVVTPAGDVLAMTTEEVSHV
jgi:hypothetical protein